MKKLLIFIILLHSCEATNDTYKSLTKQIKLNTKILEIKTLRLKKRLKHLMDESPLITKHWYIKSNSLSQKSNIIKHYVDSLLNIKLERKSYRLNSSELNFLKNEIKNLQKIKLSETEGKWYRENIRKVLSIKEWQNINVLNSQKATKYEFIAILNKLRFDITASEFELQRFINYNITSCHDGWNNISTFVIPKSNIINEGDFYEADIYLAAYDTTVILTYEIGDKKTETVEGVVNYKHKVTEAPGFVTIPGKLILKNPRTGKDSIIPFEIKYEVLEKSK